MGGGLPHLFLHGLQLYAGEKEISRPMDKIFDKLPYDTLEDIKFLHLLAGGVAIGLAIIAAYYFTLFSATNTELTGLVKKKETAERTLKRHKAIVKKGDLAEKDLARVSGQLDAYKKQMPVADDLHRLLKKVSGFGENRIIEFFARRRFGERFL
jgi:Tfp pilus assembly protein PilO